MKARRRSMRRYMFKLPDRVFSRDYKPRQVCFCELCLMKFGRMLYPYSGNIGMPIRLRRIKGFSGNFKTR